MTLDELRAAAPQADWTVNAGGAMDSKDQPTYRASAVLMLDGLPYDARITRGWYGAYKLQLVQKAQQRDARACMKVYEGLVAELESRYGAFAAANTEYKEESIFFTQGQPSRTSTKDAGKSSQYTLHTTAEFSEATSRLAHSSGELSTVGQYFVDSRLFGQSMCVTSFTIEIQGKPPKFEEISVDELKLVRTPSRGTLHNSLEGVALPAGGVTIKARCRLARKSGGIGDCEYDPKPPTGISDAIFLRKEEMGFDIANLSPGNPVPLFTQVEFRLDPAERLALGTPVTPLAADDIDWSSAEDSIPGRSSITTAAGRSEEKPDTATATVDCQVQSDGSLACLQLDVALHEGVVVDSHNIFRFTSKARENLRDRRAASLTKSGAPTRGRWVHFEIPMKLRHDSQEEFDKRLREYREARKKKDEVR